MKEEKHPFQESNSVESQNQRQRPFLFCSNAEEACLLDFWWNQNEQNSFYKTPKKVMWGKSG